MKNTEALTMPHFWCNLTTMDFNSEETLYKNISILITEPVLCAIVFHDTQDMVINMFSI